MYYRFSKLSKTVIIINIILSIILIAYHSVNVVKSVESYKLVEEYQLEYKVDFETAVKELTEQGETLLIGALYFSIVYIVYCIIAILLLRRYAMKNGFAAGFIAAIMCLFSSFIGGLMMFYVFFSSRREVSHRSRPYMGYDKWTRFIHKRAEEDVSQ